MFKIDKINYTILDDVHQSFEFQYISKLITGIRVHSINDYLHFIIYSKLLIIYGYLRNYL